MEGIQYLDLIHTHSALFYFVINRMMSVKTFIGVIGAIVSILTLLYLMDCTREDIESINNKKLALLIFLSGPILLIIALLIPDPDTLRHVIAISLIDPMDPMIALDLESYKEAVNAIEQFIKEAY